MISESNKFNRLRDNKSSIEHSGIPKLDKRQIFRETEQKTNQNQKLHFETNFIERQLTSQK
jgi:hypothetical protein